MQTEKDAKIYTPLIILEQIAKVDPPFLDRFAPALVKQFQRLTKEMVTKKSSNTDRSMLSSRVNACTRFRYLLP